MTFERWDIYFALVPHEEDPSVKERHPVLIWNETEAFLITFGMTSTYRGDRGMEYQLKDWALSGLDHETSVRLHRYVQIDKNDVQEKVGTVQFADRLAIERKLLNNG